MSIPGVARYLSMFCLLDGPPKAWRKTSLPKVIPGDAHGLGGADLQCPADGVPGVAERSGDVHPDAEGADGAVSVEELGVAFAAGPFDRQAQVELTRKEHVAVARDGQLAEARGCGGVEGAVARPSATGVFGRAVASR